MAITACKVSKFSGGVCLRTPLESFLVLKLLKTNSAGKTALEKVTKFGGPYLKKILNTPLAPHEIFSKGLFTPISGSKSLSI